MTTVYKIWCEWDMAFPELFFSEAEAEDAIQDVNWEDEVDMTLEEVKEAGLVYIEEVECV